MLQAILTQIRSRLGLTGRPVIMAYRGYGNPGRVFLKGHVLDDRMLYEAKREDRKRKNFLAMISRYMSRSLPDQRIHIHFAGGTHTVTSDAAGYFELELAFDPPLRERGWLPARYEMPDPLPNGEKAPFTESSVYIREKESEFGVISDVDDTILVSHASKTLRKLRLVLTKNATTRLPFTGVAAFYHALQSGRGPGYHNPIFYVSSSEWNLYDFLVDFFEHRGLPKGPFLLQKYKQNLWEILRSGGGSHTHKVDKIRHLLAAYPDLDFILIGDSGQKDGLLYAEIVREFPHRILAVYIRDVTSSGRKEALLHELTEELARRGVDMLLVADTAAAARHAFERGFISEEEYHAVQSEVAGKSAGILG